jgi:predicted nuclease of predicted toxin-antitoxin system
MRLLADENFPRAVIAALRGDGHDVASIWEQARGAPDDAVLRLAQHEQRIVVTFDKDFGELAFRRGLPAACGIVLFRIGAQSPAMLAHRVVNVLHSRTDWAGQFASVDEEHIRVRPLATGPS